jgi:hypothetical protein
MDVDRFRIFEIAGRKAFVFARHYILFVGEVRSESKPEVVRLSSVSGLPQERTSSARLPRSVSCHNRTHAPNKWPRYSITLSVAAVTFLYFTRRT